MRKDANLVGNQYSLISSSGYWAQVSLSLPLNKSRLPSGRAELPDADPVIPRPPSHLPQLAWQPFSAWLIVKVPHRILMAVIVIAWGISTCGLAASTNFPGLLASRFLLALFEAS